MSDVSRRDAAVRRIIFIEGCANLMVLLLKLWVGLVSGSLAILGDAIHSLTDLVNNVVAWFVTRLSSQPPDREHPYGHRKFETLAVFFLASLLVVMALELALSAIRRGDTPVQSSPVELYMMLFVLLINVSLAAWQRVWAKRLNSDILLADSSHTFADVLTTSVVLLGWQIAAMGFFWLDRLCALAVAGLVLYLAYGLFKSVTPALLDEYSLDPEELSELIAEVPGVNHVGRVRSRWIGSEKAVDMVIMVAPDLTMQESHDIADVIEDKLQEQFSVHDVSIHIEPFID